MKTRVMLAAAVLPLLVVSLAQADTSILATTKHNFSKYSWSSNQICKPCHTPHNAIITDGISDRIWNHTLSESSYTVNGGMDYDAFGNKDTLAAGGTVTQDEMDRVSRLCLSCHDGTVALDSFGGADGGETFIGSVNANADFGSDLRNDHPVGLEALIINGESYTTNPDGTTTSGSNYATRFRSANLTPGSGTSAAKIKTVTVSSDYVGTVLPTASGTLPLVQTANDPAVYRRLITAAVADNPATPDVNEATPAVYGPAQTYAVSCNSCHTPHGQANAAKTAALPSLLRMDNTNSALCLSCHIK